MRYFLVCNPGSRSHRGGVTADACRELLRARGADFECASTNDLDDAERLAREAVAAGFDAVVAVGGDGTINRVVNGFFGPDGQPPAARLGVLYAGTSPDFCRFHGLPTEPEAAVDALLMGTPRAIDVCRITGTDSAVFASSANLGLGAGIARRSNRCRARLGDFLGTLWGTLATVLTTRPAPFRVTVDGSETVLDKVLNITVGKNPFLASGLKLDIDVSPLEGGMFFFAVCGMGRIRFLLSLRRLYSGAIARDGRCLLEHGVSHVRVEPLGRPVEAEFDGDPAGWCPVEISLLPRAIHLIGPRP
jgi:diacylglycerol kinase family enzyme